MSDDVLKPQVAPASMFVQPCTVSAAEPVPAQGPLGAMRLAVKDLFDIAGMRTGAGNPDWLATHRPAAATAPCVERLVSAGMIVVGKTITDELAWSLNGRNAHYGTPPNTQAPGRLPGGSSSGSAAAVAAGLADIALGTDTGGSVRLPASYCGLWGIRPSHGRVPADGLVNLAPSYDVPGWFAGDPVLLLEAGRVLLDDVDFDSDPDAPRLVLASDVWESASPPSRDALSKPLRALSDAFGGIGTASLAGAEPLSAWRATFATLQASEAWETHGAWITRTRPTFGPDIAQRFDAASRLDPATVEAAKAHRDAIVRRLDALLTPGTIVLMPTVPGPAPFLDASNETLDAHRLAAIEGLCAAGHGGLPQLSMPVARVDGAPLGLSILGPRGADERLLTLATRIAEIISHA